MPIGLPTQQTNAAILASQQAKDQAKIAEQERLIADAARQDAIKARDAARKSDEDRRRLLYASNMQLADHLWHTGVGTPRKIQELLLPWIPTDEKDEDLRDFAWRFQWNRLPPFRRTNRNGHPGRDLLARRQVVD